MSAESILQITATTLGVLTALAALATGIRSGALRRVRFGSFELEALEPERRQARALIDAVATPDRNVPFETEQLAQYYAQVLAQSKVSFWFSLVFASLGFAVIIFAVFNQSGNSTATTMAQALAGVVIDTVAALFFAQSRAAQNSMGEFFEKLRRDRQQAESRSLCESIHNPDAKDALKIRLALYYAGIQKSDEIANGVVAAAFGSTHSPERCIGRRNDATDSHKV